jgi:hypothetical protein
MPVGKTHIQPLSRTQSRFRATNAPRHRVIQHLANGDDPHLSLTFPLDQQLRIETLRAVTRIKWWLPVLFFP